MEFNIKILILFTINYDFLRTALNNCELIRDIRFTFLVAYDWLYIFLPSLIAAVLLGLLIGLWCKRQRRKSCSSKLSPQSISEQLIPTHLQTSNLSHPQPIEMQKVIPRIPMGIHEVSPQSIRFLHELGDGMFGKVYR